MADELNYEIQEGGNYSIERLQKKNENSDTMTVAELFIDAERVLVNVKVEEENADGTGTQIVDKKITLQDYLDNMYYITCKSGKDIGKNSIIRVVTNS